MVIDNRSKVKGIQSYTRVKKLQPYRCLCNSDELIALAQPFVIHLFIVEFGGGEHQQCKCLKWYNTVVS